MITADAISISFSVSDSYVQHLAVVLTSFLVNNPDEQFVFHVLHRNISGAHEAKVRELETMYPHGRIVFHKIDASIFDKFPIPANLEHVTQEMYYRYLLPDVLADEARTIYSDVDVLCVAPIRELWEWNLKGALVAGVPDAKSALPAFAPYKVQLGMRPDSDYFYSGLLVMDLVALRAGGYVKKLFDNTARLATKISWPDQDVINLTFEGHTTQIPDVWNETRKYSFLRHDVKIWHFPGFIQKPWCNIWKNYTWIPYLRYLRKSPFKKQTYRFLLGHLKGCIFYRYAKKRIERTLICGVLVYKKKLGVGSTTSALVPKSGLKGSAQ